MSVHDIGRALVKPEFVVVKTVPVDKTICAGSTGTDSKQSDCKRLKLDTAEQSGGDGSSEGKHENGEALEGKAEKKQSRKERRGQNKDRPRVTQKLAKEEQLCHSYIDGVLGEPCRDVSKCSFIHDVAHYLALPTIQSSKIDKDCYCYLTYGKCYRGVTCLFSKSHTDPENKNVVNEELWKEMKPVFESTHKPILTREVQQELRTRKFDFGPVNTICNKVEREIKAKKSQSMDQDSKSTPSGPITDEDEIPLRPQEFKRVDWKDKLYLSPLTTVGNLPFRRICVDFGADITCSEMSLASSIVHGQNHEFALHRRHPCEKIWGVQLCASNANLAAKACNVLSATGVDYDFVDLNMGCPLEPIYQQGAGSGLMCKTNRVESMAKTLSTVLALENKPFTVKMRAGVKLDKYIAHDLISLCRDSGVAGVTLHGRTREQRYLKTANWDYISNCVQFAAPMPLFGNGDVLSWEDYVEKKSRSDVSGVMIGRGALMKPWIFQEIKEQRSIDMTSSQRLEVIQRYCNYGLDHWGSDFKGVETCRRFLLEWLSFLYRYIPLGILQNPPQRMNQQPPKYFGRDEMETLLASGYAEDWVKISEIFLGPVPQGFKFLPKHKANSWG